MIKEKFVKADYPLRFVNSVVNEFQKGKEYGDESFMILPSLFEITKPFIFVGRNKHINPTKSSEPSKHLQSNINHYFTWPVISNAPKNARTRNNLGASYIALWKSDINEQKTLKG